jgi:hypothetical protein
MQSNKYGEKLLKLGKFKLVVIFFVTFFAISSFAYGSFNSINADGPFNIQVYPATKAYIEMTQSTRPYVNVWVKDGTLYMRQVEIKEKGKVKVITTPMNVQVFVPSLSEVTVNGKTNLSLSKDIRSYGLVITAEGQDSVVLDGVYNVSKIIASGDSYVSIRWINSNKISINACECAQVFLAGVAKVIEARLGDAAYLDAKYLRPHIALVQTSGEAVAEVLSINSLYAFAEGRSNIYYFKRPRNQYLEYTSLSGNVLRLGNWK